MKNLYIILYFLSISGLYGQIDIHHVEAYKPGVFSIYSESGNVTGTAFVVGKNERYHYLATAKHVLNGSKSVHLISLEGQRFDATTVYEDDVHDLALLQAPLLDIPIEAIPIVTDIAMNDEVGFVSMKDAGKILPSRGTGIVRDVTGESLTLIMREVELGHSGSPLFCKDGIVGIIVKNGRFIECLNIMLAKEIIDEWGEGLFEGLFVEQKIDRARLPQSGTTLNHAEEIISIKGIHGDGVCQTGLINLIDGYLNTSWSCPGSVGDVRMVRLAFYKSTPISKLEIYISDESLGELPYGNIHVFDNDENNVISFESIFRHKRRQSRGYWYIYLFEKPILATEVAFGLNYMGPEPGTVTLNEIQFYGINL